MPLHLAARRRVVNEANDRLRRAGALELAQVALVCDEGDGAVGALSQEAQDLQRACARLGWDHEYYVR